MSNYETVKLPNLGDSVTLRVEQVYYNPKSDKIKYPDYTFCGQSAQGAVRVNVPEKSAQRQAARIRAGMDPLELKGETITISRSPSDNPAKHYWDITIATPADLKAKPESKRVPPPPTRVPGDAPDRYRDVPPPDDEDMPPYEGADDGPFETPSIADQKWEKIVSAYGKAWEAAFKVQKGVGTPESVNAGAATILIAAQKAGVC